MGRKQPKGGSSSGAAVSTAVEDDDALLDTAIAENKKLSEAAVDNATVGPRIINGKGTGPPAAALTKEAIVKKLNAIPTFCILNGQESIVGLKDPSDPTGQLEVCLWFADPQEAKTTLAAAKEANPEIRAQLHLGVTPLGVAYAIAAGWAECHFFGEKQLRGSSEPFAGGQDPTALLREQAVSQGMEPPPWHVPVFCCDELQSPTTMPIFLSRKAMAEAWVTSGRKIQAMPENLSVMDLGVLVCQMQTDAFAWSTCHFVCERRSVQLVKESKSAAAEALALPQWQPEGGPAGGEDDPPPLDAPSAAPSRPEDDDAPPPLE